MVMVVVVLVGYCGLMVVVVVLIVFVRVAFVVVIRLRELLLSGCFVMVVLILVGL